MSRPAVLVFSLTLLASAFTAQVACAQVSVPSSQPVVIAYVFPQNSLLQPAEVDPHSLSRVNYAFANIEAGRMVPGFLHDGENLSTLTALRKQNARLQILVSVGGWAWSAGFSDVARTRKSRSNFIDSVVEFLTRYDLDGLDIDWEYPGMAGAGHAFRSEDKANFTLLLRELRERLDSNEKLRSRHRVLSIAAGASNEFLDHTEMARVEEYVDTVNLMSYDYYEPSDDKVTGHHAPLFTNPSDPKKISADASVHAFEAAGVPPAKIVVGIPFYGHVWGQVPNHNHGLYQAGRNVPNAYTPYSVITGELLHQGFQRFWDPVALAPYLYNSEKKIFVTYDDPQSVAAKCNYVLEHKLGGVMFWDYGSDPSHILLNTIHDHLEATGRPSQNSGPRNR